MAVMTPFLNCALSSVVVCLGCPTLGALPCFRFSRSAREDADMTYIHTYIHTYSRAYMYTYRQAGRQAGSTVYACSVICSNIRSALIMCICPYTVNPARPSTGKPRILNPKTSYCNGTAPRHAKPHRTPGYGILQYTGHIWSALQVKVPYRGSFF